VDGVARVGTDVGSPSQRSSDFSYSIRRKPSLRRKRRPPNQPTRTRPTVRLISSHWTSRPAKSFGGDLKSRRFSTKTAQIGISPASTTPTVTADEVFFSPCGGCSPGRLSLRLSIEGKRLWHRALGPWGGCAWGSAQVRWVIDSQLILFNSQQVDELESWGRNRRRKLQ